MKVIGVVVLLFDNNRTLCLEDCLFVMPQNRGVH